MPGLGFSPRFADLVESGKKVQTIRSPRKHPIRRGDRVYLWTGLRTPKARKLGEGIVELVEPIALSECRDTLTLEIGRGARALFHGRRWDHALAIADGFESFEALVAWFRDAHGLPFRGDLIRWRLLPRAEWRKP